MLENLESSSKIVNYIKSAETVIVPMTEDVLRSVLIKKNISIHTVILVYSVPIFFQQSDTHDGLQGNFKVTDIDPTICTHIIYNSIWYTEGFTMFWAPRSMHIFY